MIPTEQEHFFRIEGVSGMGVSCLGLLNNAELVMDWVSIDSSIETRWAIQNRGISFMVARGSMEVRFRLNDNIHSKNLNVEQSIRIPPGVPFQLVTFEKNCSVLLISQGGS